MFPKPKLPTPIVELHNNGGLVGEAQKVDHMRASAPFRPMRVRKPKGF